MDLKILDFDLECKPGHWIGGDFVSKIITAAAWSWVGEDKVYALTHYDFSPDEIAGTLAGIIYQADIVTGHYIRGFDLPLLNGELLRGGRSSLGRVLTSDTKLDLVKVHGRSQSQENLGSLLGISAPKVNVSNPDWEAFNSQLPYAKEIGLERVKGDVLQHKQLRDKLISLGWLGPVRPWEPTPQGKGKYRA